MRTLCLVLVVAGAGCDPALVTQLGLVTARELAGSYTGVLQGVLENPQRQVIVDLDLLHEVTIRDAGALTVRIQSRVIPPLRAVIVGRGPVAVNAELVEFENLDIAHDSIHFDAVKVKQIVFVQYEGEWIVVLQLVKVGVAQEHVNDVYVYQYVSYPRRVAERMSKEEAIVYVNTILKLIPQT